MKLTAKPLCVMTAVLALATGAGAQTYTVLRNFNPNSNATGYQPTGTPVQGPDGTLYGVATSGGSGASGVVFRIQTNGTGFTVIKNFPLTNSVTGTNSDGAGPLAGLILSGSTLYGTTGSGGSSGQGTVFSLSTNGNNYTVLKNFTALDPVAGTNTDGASPGAALLLSGSTLYGTTQYGGAGRNGTIFRVSTNGSNFTNFYSFTSNGASDGANPTAPLILSGSTLYGTASAGGDDGIGTVFSVSTNGTGFNRLHSFSGTGTDGDSPYGGLLLSGGLLYGTTAFGDNGSGDGDGTVFRVSVTGGSSFTNLYSFTGPDGSGPEGELVLSGSTLYGTTSGGGAYNYYGTVFQINTDGTGFAVVGSLNGDNGAGPQYGLVLSGSTLYGTAVNYGLLPTVFAFASGTVFSVDVSGGVPADLCVFPGASGAAFPEAGLALSGNTLFGTTVNGGGNNNGTVFEINTNGSGYAENWDFSAWNNNGDNSDGARPVAVMVLSGGVFYGTTQSGGTNGWGAVIKMNADGTGFTNIYSFTSPYDHSAPFEALVVSGSTIYGPGGAGSYGSLFKLNTDGTGFTNFYSFTGGSGGNGPGGLTLSGNTLYGATGSGGVGYGNLYQVNTDGSDYTNIYSFSGGSDGATPGAVLVLSNNVLYGAAFYGGTNGQGTAFKINTDQSGFTVLHTFASTNSGSVVPGNLLLSGNTLYGTTASGGSSDNGTVFQMDTSGNNFTVLKNFAGGDDGATPNSTLVLAGGTLYGTTYSGGLSGDGTVFSLALSSVVVPIPLSIRGIGNAVVLSWTDPASVFSLQAAPLVTGTYTNVPGASSPYTNAIGGATEFFRLQAN
ncbi:MAG: choice-of-anchor tandem repeat GloVer-containing protein [Verrucomicrobiota bacterium]